MFLFQFMKKRTSFNPFVIGVTLFFVLLLMAMILIVPAQTQALLNQAKTSIFANFSWFYILAFSVFLGFLLILAVSSLGSIKLGLDEEEPEFGFFILACDVICCWYGCWADVFWRSRTINSLSF